MTERDIWGLTRRLAAQALAAGDPTGWFEPLYSAAAEADAAPPWNREAPREVLRQWAQQRELAGDGRRAMVVGCGLGADAEYVASLGFATVAFDISPTAIRLARERSASDVEYLTADLLAPPAQWREAFDLVVECLTVQALPDPPRAQAIANIADLVAPDGTLIVVAGARDAADGPVDGPPWPLTRAEIEAFAAGGVELVEAALVTDPEQPSERCWRAEYRRPAAA